MITVNMDKAKQIGHEIRRQERDKEFEPFDKVIALQIPGVKTQEAEAERQKIRDKYSEIQAKIDSSKSPEDVKKALGII